MSSHFVDHVIKVKSLQLEKGRATEAAQWIMLDAEQIENATYVFPEPYMGILCIISCSLSIIGCFSILYSYIRWREQRTTARLIVMCIAVADLLTACGYLVMSSYYLNSGVLGQTYNRSEVFTGSRHATLRVLCAGQSLLTTTSSSWSFWWTTVLAVHMYLGFVLNRWSLSRRLLPLYFALCWLVPPLYTVPALATGWLGIGCSSVSVTWCFVGANHSLACTNWVFYLLEAVEGKVWEIAALVTISLLYFRIWLRIVRARRKQGGGDSERSQLLSSSRRGPASIIDWTVLLIPLVFLFIRSWGNLRYFLSLGPSSAPGLLSDQVLSAFQAIFDPSQGWTNALIFVLLSKRSLQGGQLCWQGLRNCVVKDLRALRGCWAGLGAGQLQEPHRTTAPVSYREVSAVSPDSSDHDEEKVTA